MNEDPFFERLKELIKNKTFSQLCFIKIVWNFTGRKFFSIIMGIAAFFVFLVLYKITKNEIFIFKPIWLFGLIAYYSGINIFEKFGKK